MILLGAATSRTRDGGWGCQASCHNSTGLLLCPLIKIPFMRGQLIKLLPGICSNSQLRVRLQDTQFIMIQAVQSVQCRALSAVFTVQYLPTSHCSFLLPDESQYIAGSVEDPAAKLLQNPLQLEQEEHSEAEPNPRQGRNLEDGLTESRPILHPPSSRSRWTARSTTERTVIRNAWTPIPNTQSPLNPFGRKISRESQFLRKVNLLPSSSIMVWSSSPLI